MEDIPEKKIEGVAVEVRSNERMPYPLKALEFVYWLQRHPTSAIDGYRLHSGHGYAPC